MMILMNKKIKIKFAELLDICSHWKSSKKRMQNEEKFAMIEEGEECL